MADDIILEYDGELLVEFKQRDDRSEIVNYNCPSFPCFSFPGFLTGIEPWVRNAHWHEDIEILTVKKGTMAYNVNGKLIELNKGDSLFVNSRNLHYSDGINLQYAEYHIIVAHPRILSSTNIVDRDYLLPVLTDANCEYILFQNGTKAASEISAQSQNIIDNHENPLEITRSLFNIWHHIYEEHSKMNDKKSTSPSYRIESVKDMIGFIKDNYQNKITLGQIANHGNVSKSTCNNLFKSCTGYTPTDYLIRYRIDKAIELLQNTEDNISTISGKCGFNTPSYMTEQFVRCLKVTPREFRRQMQEA
ncbi:MAG: AraC family transcriptional regulator [Saccharofermentans sp.]|nr:AraC family transcriptional regulator [Saccharofermentans sp.]